MVKVWAEKEMRNLKRIRAAGIPSPEPLLLRMHVLLMEFLGDKNGWYTFCVILGHIRDLKTQLFLKTNTLSSTSK